jgi:hypothetical protein
MTAFGRAVFFLSAFLPVLPLIAFRTWQKNEALAIACLILAGVIAVLTVGLMGLLRSGTCRSVTVASATTRAESVVGFITGYLLPASLIDGSDTSVVIVNFGAFVFLLLVAVRTHLVYFNPLLALFGWHLHEVETRPAGDKGVAEHLTLLVNQAQLAGGTSLDVFGTAGSLELAKVVNTHA